MARAVSALLVAFIGLCLGAAGAGPGRAASVKPRVVLVLDSAWQESNFERSAYDGWRRAVRELGIDGRLLVAGPKEPMLPVYLAAARQRPDLVVALPGLTPPALDAAAQKFPEQRFLSLDVPVEAFTHLPRNVRGTVFRVEEPSYLAGYLAGLIEKRRPGKDMVSSVEAEKRPQIDRFVAGFQAGARRADRAVTALNGYANEYLDTEKCRQVALDQIAKGSGVVFALAGPCGDGALAAAKEHGVFGVGVDTDQSGLGPHILTSVVKRMDVAAYRAIRSLVDGRFRTGGNSMLTLSNGGVGLGKISPRVPRSSVEKVNTIRRQILSGRITGIPIAIG